MSTLLSYNSTLNPIRPSIWSNLILMNLYISQNSWKIILILGVCIKKGRRKRLSTLFQINMPKRGRHKKNWLWSIISIRCICQDDWLYMQWNETSSRNWLEIEIQSNTLLRLLGEVQRMKTTLFYFELHHVAPKLGLSYWWNTINWAGNN